MKYVAVIERLYVSRGCLVRTRAVAHKTFIRAGIETFQCACGNGFVLEVVFGGQIFFQKSVAVDKPYQFVARRNAVGVACARKRDFKRCDFA